MKSFFSGPGSLAHLTGILSALNVQRIMVVCGKSSFHQSGLKQKVEALLANYQFCFFNDYVENPTLENAIAGVEVFRQFQAQAIIAIGGGSAIDTAKAINVFQASADEPETLLAKPAHINPGVSLIAIPTTAGTGSEATHFAVIYHKGKKYSLVHDSMLPSFSILDAELTLNKSAYLTASTAFDALCQALESLWATQSTQQSRNFAGEAIELILKHLPNTLEYNSLGSRQALLKAANLAGKAINITKTTAPHALSYAITAKYGVPHGHAVALTLGQLGQHFLSCQSAEKLNYALEQQRRVSQLIMKYFGLDKATDFLAAWQKLMIDSGLEFNWSRIGISDSQALLDVIEQVNVERLSNHPIQLTLADLKAILT